MKDLVPGPADPAGKGKYVQKGVFGGYVMVDGKRLENHKELQSHCRKRG